MELAEKVTKLEDELKSFKQAYSEHHAFIISKISMIEAAVQLMLRELDNIHGEEKTFQRMNITP